jgi:PAS domain-containing protein
MAIGLNPRTPYDDNYQRFILVASRLLSTSLSAILLHEEEISRQERAIAQAETMKIELMVQLLITQKEVERNHRKFRQFTERCDIGMFIIDLDGTYTYRNEAWYKICKPDTYEGNVEDAWNEVVDDDYARAGRIEFEKVVKDKKKHVCCSKYRKSSY